MKKTLLLLVLVFALIASFAQTSVVIIDNIIAPSGEYKIGDEVAFTFDLHNTGPNATINPITINYNLPTGLSLASGSSLIFSQNH